LSASPGAYAMLLGSGTSTAAQIPTGWEVVVDLIRKVAALKSEDAARDAAADPEGWWTRQGHGDPRYDTLLEALAPTVAARRDLLHSYFETADDDERERGAKQPTAAHRAIAELVSEGRIRLILTTNFDHLIEDALTSAGVPPQVIARPEAIRGMAPLQHARATVIKLHGDYLDVDAMRNTPAELAAYDPAMQDLLARVLDEYGLIVLGWSGEWDIALARAIEECPSRRYPTYWAAYQGRISAAGSRLLANRAGYLVPIAAADTFCTGLRDNVRTLARMADPPPTRAVAVATLKRNLRPERLVDAFDQINITTSHTIERLTQDRYPVRTGATTNEELAPELERQLTSYDADTDVLAALAATAAFHGDADTDALVVRAVRRVAEVPRDLGSFLEALGDARRYPALRLATCAGVAAVAAGREGLLVPLLVQTTSAALSNTGEETPLVWCLFPWRVILADVAARMPQDQPNRVPSQPASHYLRMSCRAALADVTDDREYKTAFDRYEFLRGMLEIHYTREKRAALGEFVGRFGATRSVPDADQIDDQWPLVAAGGFDGDPEKARGAHAAVVQQISQTPWF
jgi:hypothetical protein